MHITIQKWGFGLGHTLQVLNGRLPLEVFGILVDERDGQVGTERHRFETVVTDAPLEDMTTVFNNSQPASQSTIIWMGLGVSR